ncbi:hypothetical protein DRW41_01455 [Neobacillus piezotolerans]|uniref:SbsC C-terminal domain-containing protein n=1 Tax=Neobacillus piezotolerans TaxID=2259171 RepID=A0A3D8GUV4_9BACI|nr:hypothetical protein [Neobacillus piezotolerans]RDU38264.1 hypothetical protein DRW41_01455 [Neobacillus piezotolerans]
MKKSLKIAAPALALGLVFSSAANVSASTAGHKSDAKKVTVSVSVKAAAKDKEAKKRLESILKNISKVDSSTSKLAKATAELYAKAGTGNLSVKAEADFYKSTSGKLKANSNQLKAYKGQVDQVAKKYGKTESVNAAYAKITALNNVISQRQKKLADLHNQFVQAQKSKDASKLLAAIQESVVKAEAKNAALSKATAEFYAKAATTPVTAAAEMEFYKKTAADLGSVSKDLANVKNQLDGLVKYYGKTDVTTALYARISLQNEAVAVVKKSLDNLHNQYLQKAAVNQLALITEAVLKAEANMAATSKAIADYYASAATTPVTVNAEAEFYKKATGEINAHASQLSSLKKQLDAQVKVSGQSDAAKALYAKIAVQTEANAALKKKLNDLHSQYMKAEAAKQVAVVAGEVAKVEARVAAAAKATAEFYAKAATTPVTAKAEAEFYVGMTGELAASSIQLAGVKKQLDELVKKQGNTEASIAVYAKITAQNQAIAAASKTLLELHINFKPASA